VLPGAGRALGPVPGLSGRTRRPWSAPGAGVLTGGVPDDPRTAEPATEPAAEPADVGGDPVCWLHRTCPECGAMPSQDEDPDRCWRCGHRLPAPPG
jgi:hypothetical protein